MAKERGIIAETDSKTEDKAEKERKEIMTTTKSESEKMELVNQVKAVKQMESIYTMEELSANAGQLFDVRTECVIAALKAANIKACTISKAKEIIKKFMEMEVR